ncbi:MAG: FapA family protein [Angelakisella sp.]|nr:FapA family protein [Angelakisella sp.]
MDRQNKINNEHVKNGSEQNQSLINRLWNKWADKNQGDNESLEKSRVDAVSVDQTTEDNVQSDEVQNHKPVNEAVPDEPKQEETEKQEDRTPIDSQVVITFNEKKLAAVARVLSPKYGGEDITEEKLRQALADNGIVYGISEISITTIVKFKKYDSNFTIATGQSPVNGKDGYVTDCFERKKQIKLKAREDGTMDYKNLNLIQNIEQDTVICNIVPTVPGTDGIDVLGNKVAYMPGREPVIPRGKNTAVTEDGLKLIATCSGSLSFRDDVFNVDDVIHIDRNIDNSVGNIDFCGEVCVNGDVCEGFNIKACKDVNVKGTVEGASIYSKGNITLYKGMNGMVKGDLVAEKNIKSKFLENCTAKAGGSIVAESIVNSNISADDKIIVKGRRGVIVGGMCSALNSIEAVAVGTASNVTTVLRVGATPDTYKKKNELTRELNHLMQEVESLTKDIIYLENFAKDSPLSPNRQAILNEKRKMKTISLIKLSGITKQLEKLNEQIQDVTNCRINCKQIYPLSRIEIGNSVYIVKEYAQNIFFYFNDGEIKTGKL